MVGPRPGLTAELKQRIRVISELATPERDYRAVVTEQNLIHSGLAQAPSGMHSPLLTGYDYLDHWFMLILTTFNVLADMNSLNWSSPSGRKARAGRGAGASTSRDAVRPKRGREEVPPSPVVGGSSGSSGQRREQLPPRPARSSHADRGVPSSSESVDSRSRYLEALKSSLGDISQGEWDTFEGLADEDAMGAAARASMMVRSFLTCVLYACTSYLVY